MVRSNVMPLFITTIMMMCVLSIVYSVLMPIMWTQLSDRMSGLAVRIGLVEEDLTELDSQVQNNTEDISQLQADVNALAERVQNNTEDIDQLQGDVNALNNTSAEIARLNAELMALQMIVQNNTDDLQLHANQIAQLTQEIEILQELVQNHTLLLAEHTTELAAINLAIENLQELVQNNTALLQLHQTELDQLNIEVDQLSSLIQNQTAEIEHLSEMVTDIQEAVQNNTIMIAEQQVELDLLRSELVELQSSMANITTLQTGTFMWTISASSNCGQVSPSQIVYYPWQVWTRGSGYRVNDLVIVTVPIVNAPNMINTPILRITSVNASGSVFGLQTLYPGIQATGVNIPQGPFPTTTLFGTGLTILSSGVSAIGLSNTTRFNYIAPSSLTTFPMQESTYQLREFNINGAIFDVLDLQPPEFPMRFLYHSAATVSSGSVCMYNHQPPIFQLIAPGSADRVAPLTRYNINRVYLRDNTGCASSGICYFSGYPTTAPTTIPWKNAFAYDTIFFQSSDNNFRSVSLPFIRMNIDQDPLTFGYNFRQNNFTVSFDSLSIVLPN